jgi:hypothetical protein
VAENVALVHVCKWVHMRWRRTRTQISMDTSSPEVVPRCEISRRSCTILSRYEFSWVRVLLAPEEALDWSPVVTGVMNDLIPLDSEFFLFSPRSSRFFASKRSTYCDITLRVKLVTHNEFQQLYKSSLQTTRMFFFILQITSIFLEV